MAIEIVGPRLVGGALTLSKLRRMYYGSMENAKRVLADGTVMNVPWQMTFGEWLQVWVDSGHLHERGPRRGQYVMARNGDTGVYRVGNVKIITADDNMRESYRNGSHTRCRSSATPLRLPPLRKLKPGVARKLSLEQVNEIRRDYVQRSRTKGASAFARKFGVSAQCVLYVIMRKHWR